MTSIGDGAFFRCSSLTSVSIPDGVTSIGRDAFDSCKSLTNVTIPNSVTSIGDCAFAECIGLTSVTIPDSVTSIGEDAFSDCSLKSITIPNSVTSIGDKAFYSCTALEDINIPNGVKLDSSTLSNVLGKCPNLTNVVIGDGVKSIGTVFTGKTKLESIDLGTGITDIGERAFSGCSSLKSVNIPDSVASIGYWAFYKCSSLMSVKIGNGVTTIGESAFEVCTGLTSVTIPDSVTSIGEYAFYDCDSLTDVYYSGDEEQWNAISIGNYNYSLTNATIHYNSTMPEPEIADVKLTTETDAETGAEVITVTIETEDIFESNALLAVGFGDGGVVSVSAIENGEATLPAEGVTTVKVFAWESLESMIPLCEAKTVTVTAQ